MKKLSALASPAIAGVIREATVPAAIAEIKNCTYDGADMIDLHMSCLESMDEASLRAIIGSSKLPVLALNYNKKCNWESCNFSEETRAKSFLDAVSAGAAVRIIALVTKAKLASPKRLNAAKMCLMGVFAVALHYGFTHVGLTMTDSGKTAILKQIAPLLNCTPFVRQCDIMSNKWGAVHSPKA